MDTSYYKNCIVPQCVSTTIKTPKKLFFYVPKKKELRIKWLQLARRDTNVSSISRMYFCEDHFDLPNDMENYIKYRIMGSLSKLRLKPGCLPSRFECQTDMMEAWNTISQPFKKQKAKRLEGCSQRSTKIASSRTARKSVKRSKKKPSTSNLIVDNDSSKRLLNSANESDGFGKNIRHEGNVSQVEEEKKSIEAEVQIKVEKVESEEENDIQIKEEIEIGEETYVHIKLEPGDKGNDSKFKEEKKNIEVDVQIKAETVDIEEENDIQIEEGMEVGEETYVHIKLEREDTPLEKYESNEVLQKSKEIKLEDATEEERPLIFSVLKYQPNSKYEELDISFSKNSSKSNTDMCKRKEFASRIEGFQVNNSSKVNILPNKVQDKCAIQQEASNSRVVPNIKAEDEVIEQTPSQSTQAVPSTSLNKSNKKLYICELCNYETLKKAYLKSHIQYKHVKEKDFSCHICQYKCVKKTTLNLHLRKHTGEKPYGCDLCDYRSSLKGNLIYHMKNVHTKEKNFSCHVCQEKFVSKGKLNVHLRVHNDNKPYVCGLCDYRSAHKSYLNSHMKHKHIKEKNFSCHMCEDKFISKTNLTLHLRVHTDEKPYKCELCEYKCSQRENLKRHMKYKHTKEKNFSCHICEDKFIAKHELNTHLWKHTDKRPYRCDLCDYGCLYRVSLNSHIIAKHAKEIKK